MLSRLIIQNFILIENLEIDFESGFNVLTGETGAGKSMIIGALMMIMGARTDKKLIRKGCELSFLQACFDLKKSRLINQYGLDNDGSGTMIISREIKENGKTYSKINGELVPLKEVQKISDEILSIYGQEDRSLLFDSKEQLNILDSYIGNELSSFFEELKIIVKDYKKLSDEYDNLKILDDREIEREIDNILFQISDIDEANLTDDDENIEKKYLSVKNSADLLGDLSIISQTIDNDNDISAMNLINIIYNKVLKFSEADDTFSEYPNILDNMRFNLNDLYRDIENKVEKLSMESENLNKYEMRLDLVNSIKKKYGNSIHDVLKYRESLDLKLDDLKNLSKKRTNIKLKINSLEKLYFELSSKISEIRKNGAKKLSDKVTKSLKDLNFKNAEFNINFSKINEINLKGFDKIDFIVRFNVGSDFSLLKHTASGGELSRVMLALQEVIGNVYRIPTMIFDEIDTGVSGISANSVAKKMYKVSTKHQVISISHMLQVAIYADHHYLIEKEEDGTVTKTKVRKLDRKSRIDEICRLISIEQDSSDIRKETEKMLENVELAKAKLIKS